MARYWWVNHKQTVRQEVGGGYLWSPKTEANGVRSQFYDNMKLTSPGDFIVSYANSQINYIGVVSDYVMSAPKPEEFGQIGSYWAAEGWLLPVSWYQLSTAVYPRDHLSQIIPLLPQKYSPLNPITGYGNQKAYLAEINADLFSIITTTAGLNLDGAFPVSTRPELLELIEAGAERVIQIDTHLSATEKEQLIKARRGQGDFRTGLFQVEKHCRLTGIDNPSLLIASHIKPWRSCATASERLDCFNGLMLAPHVDYIFDRGLISFSDDGNVIISAKLVLQDLHKLGLETVIAAAPFRAEQRHYLAYHRSEVLLA